MTIRPTTRTRDVPARDDRPAIPGPRRHNGDVEEASARDQPIGRQISSVGANTPLVKLSIMLVTLISASSPKTRASVGLPAAISESKLRKNAIPPLLRSVWLATLNPALIAVTKLLTPHVGEQVSAMSRDGLTVQGHGMSRHSRVKPAMLRSLLREQLSQRWTYNTGTDLPDQLTGPANRGAAPEAIGEPSRYLPLPTAVGRSGEIRSHGLVNGGSRIEHFVSYDDLNFPN